MGTTRTRRAPGVLASADRRLSGGPPRLPRKLTGGVEPAASVKLQRVAAATPAPGWRSSSAARPRPCAERGGDLTSALDKALRDRAQGPMLQRDDGDRPRPH